MVQHEISLKYCIDLFLIYSIETVYFLQKGGGARIQTLPRLDAVLFCSLDFNEVEILIVSAIAI